ncbi:alkaline phosphatase-like [Artemia franciscana]|uniref:alkaline phosphatase-like n=1 Tax=Artemia franciscana TaxID=6661 RepID=UPI0032D9B934
MYVSGLKAAFGILFLVLTAEGDSYHKPRVRQAEQNEYNHGRLLSRRSINGKNVVEDAEFWRKQGQDTLAEQLSITNRPIERAAKNIILFLGDGMSNPTIVASRIYKGQLEGKPGEETELEFEKFPFTALSKTYCVDSQVADSACSATAFLCGVKTDIDTIGIDANVIENNCSTQNQPENHVDSIMKWAQDVGKATGIVTTTRITHATPAGAYAHVANRNWESDRDVLWNGADPTVCDDIAEQLIKNNTGKNFKVILGGGRRAFIPASEGGSRNDEVDLTSLWEEMREAEGVRYTYVRNRTELLNVNTQSTDYLLGLFSRSHLEYSIDKGEMDEPSLEEMTQAAIDILSREPNGFVLLVEGGRIDQAHHDGRAKAAFEELLEFEKAVIYASTKTNEQDTLIIVTADHSHTMTINGYPERGNSIFGIASYSDIDLLPWPTISYANGPGYRRPLENGSRVDITNDDRENKNYKPIATAPDTSESHGGEDVTIYARGPQAHLFQGVYEQNYIAHVIGYAGCMGPGLHFCDAGTNNGTSLIFSAHYNIILYIIVFVVKLYS